MTLKQKILDVMSDGKARPVSEVAALTGLTVTQARNTLAYLRKAGAMASAEMPYTITKAGRKLIKEREQAADLQRQLHQQAQQAEHRRRATLRANAVVAQGSRNAPNSVFALGGAQ